MPIDFIQSIQFNLHFEETPKTGVDIIMKTDVGSELLFYNRTTIIILMRERKTIIRSYKYPK